LSLLFDVRIQYELCIIAHPSPQHKKGHKRECFISQSTLTHSPGLLLQSLLESLIGSFPKKITIINMKFSLATSLLLLSSCSGFTTPQSSPRTPTANSLVLQSTLSPEARSFTSNDGVLEEKGALSMQIDELAAVLGGKGRAKVVWDCYSIGVDPADFFGSVINLGYDDYETIYGMLPSSRRCQRLGPETLDKLSSLYKDGKGKVENGVATLSYISQASDSTTKLLLRLADGLEIETVIIPCKGERSTLCISSLVGCGQGT
jgi:hypothetical protein